MICPDWKKAYSFFHAWRMRHACAVHCTHSLTGTHILIQPNRLFQNACRCKSLVCPNKAFQHLIWLAYTVHLLWHHSLGHVTKHAAPLSVHCYTGAIYGELRNCIPYIIHLGALPHQSHNVIIRLQKYCYFNLDKYQSLKYFYFNLDEYQS